MKPCHARFITNGASLTKLGDFRNEILSTKNRLFPFLTSDTLLQFIGIEGKTIDLLEAMNEQKIILVNGYKSPKGQNVS